MVFVWPEKTRLGEGLGVEVLIYRTRSSAATSARSYALTSGSGTRGSAPLAAPRAPTSKVRVDLSDPNRSCFVRGALGLRRDAWRGSWASPDGGHSRAEGSADIITRRERLDGPGRTPPRRRSWQNSASS